MSKKSSSKRKPLTITITHKRVTKRRIKAENNFYKELAELFTAKDLEKLK